MTLGQRLAEALPRARGGRHPSTFLLGAGAHLSGVTALHRYLATSDEVEPGPHREYHVLDSAGLASEQWVRDLLFDRAQASLDAARIYGTASGRALQRAAMIADPEIYLDFFAGLVAGPDVRLTMDLTADHALLGAEQFTTVRDGFSARDIRVVSVFVMRDPLERLVTHVRLQQRQRPELYPGDLEDWVERLHTDPTYERRTRYEHTVGALDQAFEPGEAWFGFHERLMTPDSLVAICELCRISYHEPDESWTRPQPTDTAGLPEDLARAVVDYYSDTYEFVADRFGLDDLVKLWPSGRFVL